MPKPKPPQPIPDPPLLVLAKVHQRCYRPKHKRRRVALWMIYCPEMGMFDTAGVLRFSYYPRELKVIDHPRNDAAAVKIITEAKKS